MRDIEGEKMWDGYLLNENEEGGGNGDWLAIVSAFIQSVHQRKDKDMSLAYAKELYSRFDVDSLGGPDVIPGHLREIGASDEEIAAVTGSGSPEVVEDEQGKGRYPNRDKTIPYSDGGGDHDEANIDKMPGETNPVENDWSGEGYEELDYESMSVDELKQLSPEEAKRAIEKLSHADFVYQQHNFAFTDPEQRAKIDNVRGRLKVLKDVAKSPEQREQDRVDAENKSKAEAEARSKMYPHTDGRRPGMNEVQAKKKEFRADGTFEKLGAKLSPDSEARASKSSFATRTDGDGDLLGSVQSQVVMHWFRTGELPILESLEIAMKAMNRL